MVSQKEPKKRLIIKLDKNLILYITQKNIDKLI